MNPGATVRFENRKDSLLVVEVTCPDGTQLTATLATGCIITLKPQQAGYGVVLSDSQAAGPTH